MLSSPQKALQALNQLSKKYYQQYKAKGFRKFWKETVLQSDQSPSVKIKSIMLGVFIGLTPLWGLQTIIVLLLASLLRLNKAIALLCSFISIPPLIPFIIYVSYQLGTVVYTGSLDWNLKVENIKSAADMVERIEYYMVGSCILATLMSIVIGFKSFLYFRLEPKKRISAKE